MKLEVHLQAQGKRMLLLLCLSGGVLFHGLCSTENLTPYFFTPSTTPREPVPLRGPVPLREPVPLQEPFQPPKEVAAQVGGAA